MAISIHALREEGDNAFTANERAALLFLSTPSARRATSSRPLLIPNNKFLSTPSARRATARALAWLLLTFSDFYPRPPRGGRPMGWLCTTSRSNFYPRPPRGGRLSPKAVIDITKLFLSTPSARRATAPKRSLSADDLFLSTPSARRATSETPAGMTASIFLSTPSARRATGIQLLLRRNHKYFYPRPPRGGRHARRGRAMAQDNFYPRPPRGGRPRESYTLHVRDL